MANHLPQKYQKVARAIIPYVPDSSEGHMALIHIEPTLPCFLCGQLAEQALIAPAPKYTTEVGTPWLAFPICSDCETRQISQQR